MYRRPPVSSLRTISSPALNHSSWSCPSTSFSSFCDRPSKRLTPRSHSTLDPLAIPDYPLWWTAHPRVRAGPRKACSGRQAVAEVADQIGDRDALLLHGVAVADRDGLVLERVEVDRDAERRPDLVLAAVAPPDRAGVVVVDRPAL